MSRTRKVKRTNRKRTNRVKRSRVKRYKRTKRKSRMKRGGYPGKELINRLRSNNSITVGDEIYTSGDHQLRNMDGQPGTIGSSLKPVGRRGRYTVIGTQKEGKIGRKQKYLLLEGKLKILEKNAVKYNAVVIPPGPTGPLLERGAGSGTRMHMDGI